MDNKFEPLLSMLYGYYAVVDKKTQIIKQCFKENVVFAKNVSIDTFLDMFVDREHLDKTSFDKKMLVPWIINNTKEKEVAVSIATIDQKEKTYKVRLFDDLSGEVYLYIQKPTGTNQTFNLFDKLTRIYLREGIETLIRKEINAKNPRPFSIIIIDVDNFKTINDMYGHLFGDHILKTIASMLKEYSADCNVGRIGGDEFLIQDFTEQEYDAIWIKLHNLFERIRNFDYVGTYPNEELDKLKLIDFKCTITAGLVSFPKDGETYDSLFLKADKALYRGKRKGRNCYIIYVEEKHKNILINKKIEFDPSNSRETLIYEKLILKGLNILEGSKDINETLNEYLELYGKYIIADRILLYEHTGPFSDTLIAIYTNKNIELASEKYVDKNIIESEESRTMDLNHTYKRTNIEAINDVRPNIYEFLKRQNVKSYYQVPIAIKGSLYGFIRFDSVLEEHKWKEEENTLYHIMAENVANYINIKRLSDTNVINIDKDPLTGLPSYKSCTDKINSLLKEEDKHYAIAVTNLNKFVLFNDSFGYSSGDNVLRTLAHTLSLSDFLYCGRLNGDHFLIIFKDAKVEYIEARLKDLFLEVERNLSSIAGYELLKLCAGVYITTGNESDSREILDKARTTLLKTKESKNSQYAIYNEKLNDEFINHRNIFNEFRHDIKLNKFEIFLQPKIDAKTNKLVGAEALSRWRRKDGTIWTPYKYIDILEKENELHTLDIYNVELVLKYLSDLKKKNIELFPISVNLSKHQINILAFVMKIEELRKKYDIDVKYLQIEITETSFENNYEEALGAIKFLKSLNYTICMDDFGVGYSNLGLLASGLFDVIKFDKTIVNKKDSGGKLIFEYSLKLVKSLELHMVFEGVETLEDVNNILNLGGEVIQGYYYSCPISLDEFNKKYLK